MLRFLCACLLLSVLVPHLGAQTERRFERFSTDQGLSQSTVRTILRDHRGFMWLGTDDGLNKYDGYRFVTFKRDPEDPESLSDNYIRALYEDRERVLWVGTNLGLNALDRASGRFRRFFEDGGDPGALADDSVHAIVEDREGYLWVGTDGGLSRLDPARDKFENYHHREGDPGSLPEDAIRALHLDPEGVLWVGTFDGIAVRASGTEGFRALRPIESLPREDWTVRAFADDPTGQGLWIGTSLGLFYYERSTDVLRRDSRPTPPPRNGAVGSRAGRGEVRLGVGRGRRQRNLRAHPESSRPLYPGCG